ncbi:hypothetical protein ACFX11_021173 [Malus domestica]
MLLFNTSIVHTASAIDRSFENRIGFPSQSSGMPPFNSPLNALEVCVVAAFTVHNVHIDSEFCNRGSFRYLGIIPPVVSWVAAAVSTVDMTTMKDQRNRRKQT